MSGDETHQPDGLSPGQRIRILAGVFENFEAIVESIDTESRKVHAGINVFGRVTPVELEMGDCDPVD
jgi:transcriptional antiterminator NusG